jgi:hypothetical protein
MITTWSFTKLDFFLTENPRWPPFVDIPKVKEQLTCSTSRKKNPIFQIAKFWIFVGK